MNRNKKLKGFTLVELVVVIAIFGIIIAATLTFIAPLNRVFNNAQAYSSSSGAVDNVRRAIEDNLRFANRMEVYPAPTFTDENDFIKEKVKEFREAYYIGDSVTDKKRQEYVKDKIYVMKIDNPEEFKDISQGPSRPGKISLWIYSNGDLTTPDTGSKEWVIPEAVYQDYGFSVSYGVTWDTTTVTYLSKPREMINSGTYEDFAKLTDESSFTLVLDVYGVDYADRNNKSASDYSLYKSNVSNEITLSFENLNSKIYGVKKSDEFNVVDSSTTPASELPCKVSRYRYYPPTNDDSKDIYFIYTLPEIG